MGSIRSSLFVAFIACFVGCQTGADPPPEPGSFDPVAKVLPLLRPPGEAALLEHGEQFDIGVALFRTQWLDGSQDSDIHPSARMAFAINGHPAQVGSARINGLALSWNPNGASSSSNTYSRDDSSMYGLDNSMTVTYTGFDGDSYSTIASIAPSFGAIVTPDTISASQGCRFSYGHSIPGDSIFVSVNAGDTGFVFTTPDTGAIVFRPHQLPFNSRVASDGYIIYFHRFHWSVLTSPKGKRVGVYSDQEIYPAISFPGKP